MKFIPSEVLKQLHSKLITEFGGMDGWRDEGLLEAANAYPQMFHEMAGENDVRKIAAAYCYHLIKNHAAVDGNKRIAMLSMLIFLRLNGAQCSLSEQELYELAIQAASGKIAEAEIASLLMRNKQ